ncbi:MAG: hydrolase 1, exosortase A system-associated [Blastomonas sp.]
MTRHFTFECTGETLVGSIDDAKGERGLLIVSGGNEIRAGAFGGMARLARDLAASGITVMRYDRRGIGDSSGENSGFEGSADDISAALTAFRKQCPGLREIAAFGNCDAASALALFAGKAGFAALALANPWTIETPDNAEEGETAAMPASAIRSRYLAKLRDPRELWRLVTGGVNLRKLVKGLRQAAAKQEVSGLGERLMKALSGQTVPVAILIASRDRTALAFLSIWDSASGEAARTNGYIMLQQIHSASHSFAGEDDHRWLVEQLIAVVHSC